MRKVSLIGLGFALFVAMGCHPPAPGRPRIELHSSTEIVTGTPVERVLVLARVTPAITLDTANGLAVGMTELLATCGVKSFTWRTTDREVSDRDYLDAVVSRVHPTAILTVTSKGGTVWFTNEGHRVTSELRFNVALIDAASAKTAWSAYTRFHMPTGTWTQDTESGAALALGIVSRMRSDGVLPGCPVGRLPRPEVIAVDECRRHTLAAVHNTKDTLVRERAAELAASCEYPSRGWMRTPAPEFLAARASGTSQIEPDGTTKAELEKAGRGVTGEFRVCFDGNGDVNVARAARGTGFRAYDAKILDEIRNWKFRPHVVDGLRRQVCSDIGISYAAPEREQVAQPLDPDAPPLDIKTPPADATRTASGVIYKKLVTNDAGVAPGRNDTVMVNYTSWNQSTGKTLFTNRSAARPMPFSIATSAPVFSEAMQILKKGEKAIFWVPAPAGTRSPPKASSELEVYAFEIVDIEPAPPVPADLKAAPADALALGSGAKYVVVRPGTGADQIRNFDTVTYHATAWDGDGRMFFSTEMRRRPASEPPFRVAAPLEDVLITMTAGQRVRFWVDAEKMQLHGKPLPGDPTGLVVYEVEVLQVAPGIAPPPVPTDVAKPPARAKKTRNGVVYKMLKARKRGPKPTALDTVLVHYTGWTTDGKVFDSSIQRGRPSEFLLDSVIDGWTEGLQVMSVGDKVRFWIPEHLGYKGAVGAPRGMLVFDVELLEIK